MKIIISGGTGLIGSALTNSLLAEGHKVWILTRAATNAPVFTRGAQPVQWNGHSAASWLDIFSDMDAVVNLAGSTIGAWPWTAARKRSILESRVNAGRAILEACQKTSKRPGVLIQASGIGYYGSRAAETIDESAPAGNDFLAQIATAWEAATQPVEALGVRRCIIRTAVVLAKDQGILPLMELPVKLFAGGPLGNGKQGLSWIHIDDQVAAIRFLLENPQASGPFNLTSPNPLSNADFMRSLAKALQRPYWLPAPAFALKIALGEMSTLLLDGQFATPRNLSRLGFHFKYGEIGDALTHLHG